MDNTYWIEIPDLGYTSELFECSSMKDLKAKSKKILLDNIDFDTVIVYHVRSISKTLKMKCFKNRRRACIRIIDDSDNLDILFTNFLDGHADISYINEYLKRSDCKDYLNQKCNFEFARIDAQIKHLQNFRKFVNEYLSSDFVRMIKVYTTLIADYKVNMGVDGFLSSLIHMREQHYNISKHLKTVIKNIDQKHKDLQNRHKKVCDIILLMVDKDVVQNTPLC